MGQIPRDSILVTYFCLQVWPKQYGLRERNFLLCCILPSLAASKQAAAVAARLEQKVMFT